MVIFFYLCMKSVHFNKVYGFQKMNTIIGACQAICHWNHVYAGFSSSQTQEQVISLISSSPQTEGVALIREIKRSSVCYRHMALSSTQFVLPPTYLHLTFDLGTYCLSVPSISLALSHTFPSPKCCHVILTSVCLLLSLASPHSSCHPSRRGALLVFLCE